VSISVLRRSLGSVLGNEVVRIICRHGDGRMIGRSPKPHLIPRPNPMRLPERKAVTIVAGFRCADGIVLCADTQETFGAGKTEVPKLRFEPQPKPGDAPEHKDDLVLAIAGAGDGAFIDKIVDTAWVDVQSASSFDEACQQIEESIKSTHREFGQIFQTGYLPQANLIYAVKMQGNAKLFRSQGPLVSEKNHWGSDGTGYHLSNFICNRMYKFTLSISQLIVLAVYTVYQAKRFVDGCGGTTHVATINNKGGSERVELSAIQWIEQHIRTTDWFLDDIFLKNADLQMSEADLEKAYGQHLKFLKTARENHLRSAHEFDGFLRAFSDAAKTVEEERKRGK